MLLNAQAGFEARKLDISQLKPMVKAEHVLAARKAAKALTVQEPCAGLSAGSGAENSPPQRSSPGKHLPALPCSGCRPVKPRPGYKGQDYVTPDNVKAVAPPLLRHRLILAAEAQMDGLTADRVITGILDSVPVPR